MDIEEILGVKVCNTNYEQLKQCIIDNIDNNKKTYIATINSEKVYRANKDESLKEILNNATYQIADGVGIIYASKIKRGKIRTRVTGIDTMKMICELSNEFNYKIFMYGAQQDVVEKAKEKLEEQYQNINICGYLNGFEKEEKVILDSINNSNPDILFVALGSPRQEKFISKYLDKFNCKILLGVGGAFDVISGTKKRAPKWMQKRGLEWLYRLIKEPKRFFRQIHIFTFMFSVITKKRKKIRRCSFYGNKCSRIRIYWFTNSINNGKCRIQGNRNGL